MIIRSLPICTREAMPWIKDFPPKRSEREKTARETSRSENANPPLRGIRNKAAPMKYLITMPAVLTIASTSSPSYRSMK